MTTSGPEQGDSTVERWLTERHRALISDLTDVLDLNTALREVMIPAAQHRGLVADLAGVLDFDAGLAAIGLVQTGTAEDTRTTGRDQPRGVRTVTDLVHDFAAVSPTVRLPLRGPARRFVEAVDLAHDLDRALASATVLARALADDLASASARATALALALAGAQARAWNLDGALALALARARNLAHARDLDLVHDLALARDVAHAVACDLGSALGEALAPARITFSIDIASVRPEELQRLIGTVNASSGADLVQAVAAVSPTVRLVLRELVRRFAEALDRVHRLVQVRDLDLDTVRDLAKELNINPDNAREVLARASIVHRFRSVARSLGRALADQLALVLTHAFPIDIDGVRSDDLQRLVCVVDDFTGADLRGADLTGIRLDGVRWSDDTRWPENLVERIRQDSVPLGGGVYEIRPGTTASEDLASAPPR